MIYNVLDSIGINGGNWNSLIRFLGLYLTSMSVVRIEIIDVWNLNDRFSNTILPPQYNVGSSCLQVANNGALLGTHYSH